MHPEATIAAGTTRRYRRATQNNQLASLMVLLTVTAAVKAALDEYARLQTDAGDDAELEAKFARYQQASVGSPIEHHDLVEVSRYLVSHITKHAESDATATRAWRLDTILRGADVYRPPPPPKPEPVSMPRHLSWTIC